MKIEKYLLVSLLTGTYLRGGKKTPLGSPLCFIFITLFTLVGNESFILFVSLFDRKTDRESDFNYSFPLKTFFQPFLKPVGVSRLSAVNFV